MWPGFDSQIRRQMWVAGVCWFSSLHREVFSGNSGFPSPQKLKFDFIVLIVNLSYSAVSLISAPALEKTRHLSKVPCLFNKIRRRFDVYITSFSSQSE